jgi:hypothetical protein
LVCLRLISKPEAAKVGWRIGQVSNQSLNHAHATNARIKSEIP